MSEENKTSYEVMTIAKYLLDTTNVVIKSMIDGGFMKPPSTKFMPSASRIRVLNEMIADRVRSLAAEYVKNNIARGKGDELIEKGWSLDPIGNGYIFDNIGGKPIVIMVKDKSKNTKE